jgi:N-acetylglucosaminyldiphosphoundecaprenol N-acetyl-beta-D-mannosaminyltransferase
MRRLTVVAGVPIDDVTMDEAIERIVVLVASGRQSGRAHQVVTTNADFLTNAVHDAVLRRVLRRADVSIPDGMPIVWASRLLRRRLRERVTGADLVPALARRLAASGGSMYFLGAAPGIAAAAARQLEAAHPGVRIVADPGPVFRRTDELDPAALAPIRDARPDVLCVAFGNPKQDLFIDRFASELGVPVAIGVGGTFDLLVGEKRRAAPWIQRLGLEWVFRMVQEPRRLARRYGRDFVVLAPRLVRQWWLTRRPRAWRPAPPVVAGDGGAGPLRVAVVGSLRDAAPTWPASVADAVAARRPVEVEVTATRRLDTPTISGLAELAAAVRDAGGTLAIALSEVVQRQVGRLDLDELFTT